MRGKEEASGNLLVMDPQFVANLREICVSRLRKTSKADTIGTLLEYLLRPVHHGHSHKSRRIENVPENEKKGSAHVGSEVTYLRIGVLFVR